MTTQWSPKMGPISRRLSLSCALLASGLVSSAAVAQQVPGTTDGSQTRRHTPVTRGGPDVIFQETIQGGCFSAATCIGNDADEGPTGGTITLPPVVGSPIFAYLYFEYVSESNCAADLMGDFATATINGVNINTLPFTQVGCLNANPCTGRNSTHFYRVDLMSLFAGGSYNLASLELRNFGAGGPVGELDYVQGATFMSAFCNQNATPVDVVLIENPQVTDSLGEEIQFNWGGLSPSGGSASVHLDVGNGQDAGVDDDITTFITASSGATDLGDGLFDGVLCQWYDDSVIAVGALVNGGDNSASLSIENGVDCLTANAGMICVDSTATANFCDCNDNGIDDLDECLDDLDNNGVPDDCEPGACGCMDVVFIVDDTGSMGGAIADVQSGVNSIIAQADFASDGDVQFGLVTFRAEGLTEGPEADLDLTFDQTAMQNAVNALSANAGFGLPEPSDEALNLVLNGSTNCSAETFSPMRPDCTRIVILITDALPGGCDDAFGPADQNNAILRALDAANAGVLISSIFVPTNGADPQIENIMMQYAFLTGGGYTLTADNGSGTCAAIEGIIANCGDGIIDCNNNGIDDECDVENGTSTDCDGNGVLDECEWVDCNSNGVLDICDILDGTSIDCNNNNVPDECEPAGLAGRPDPEGTTDRVLRGFVVAFAVDQENEQIRWNHLSGSAMVVDYRDGAAWEYGAWASAAVEDIDHGGPVGTPGIIRLDGVEYAAPYAELRGQFQASGSTGLSGGGNLLNADTDITLHPVSADFSSGTNGPVSTFARYFVWNQNEVKFSEALRCVECWDQSLLSRYMPVDHFTIGNIQTRTAYFRINGLAGPACSGINPATAEPLLGLANTIAHSASEKYMGGRNLLGAGTETAIIRYDPLGAPDEIAEAGGSSTRRTPAQANTLRGVTPDMDRMTVGEKGSVIIFSNVEIRWDEDGNLVQDTFLTLTNDRNEDVKVQMFFVNGDPPIEGECAEAGWNWVDNEITLTANQPTFWSALTGRPGPSLSPVSPFVILDPIPDP